MKTDTKSTLHRPYGENFYYLTCQDKIKNLDGYFLEKKKSINFCLDGIPVFAQQTIYHMHAEMRLSFGSVCVIRHHHSKLSSCSLNLTYDILVLLRISTAHHSHLVCRFFTSCIPILKECRLPSSMTSTLVLVGGLNITFLHVRVCDKLILIKCSKQNVMNEVTCMITVLL